MKVTLNRPLSWPEFWLCLIIGLGWAMGAALAWRQTAWSILWSWNPIISWAYLGGWLLDVLRQFGIGA